MAEQKNDAARAEDEARAKEKAAAEARAQAEAGEKTAADKKAEKAAQDADDARAKAAEAKSTEGGEAEPDTVASAGIVAPHVDASTSAGDPLALKRGNDPANPEPVPGLTGEPTVRLTRITPDKPGVPVETLVHEAMVGDYLRAGWSRA